MYLKLFVVATNNANMPIIKLGENSMVFDLKRCLKEELHKPIPSLIIQIADQKLDDHYRMKKVFERFEKFGYRAELKVFHNRKMICTMKFVDGVGDSKMVDAETQTQNPTHDSLLKGIINGVIYVTKIALSKIRLPAVSHRPQEPTPSRSSMESTVSTDA